MFVALDRRLTPAKGMGIKCIFFTVCCFQETPESCPPFPPLPSLPLPVPLFFPDRQTSGTNLSVLLCSCAQPAPGKVGRFCLGYSPVRPFPHPPPSLTGCAALIQMRTATTQRKGFSGRVDALLPHTEFRCPLRRRRRETGESLLPSRGWDEQKTKMIF